MHCLWEADLPLEREEHLRAVLDAKGLREDEPGTFTETVEVDGQARVRGTVTIADGRVRIDTNAEARLERLVDHVREGAGDADPLVDRRTPIW